MMQLDLPRILVFIDESRVNSRVQDLVSRHAIPPLLLLPRLPQASSIISNEMFRLHVDMERHYKGSHGGNETFHNASAIEYII